MTPKSKLSLARQAELRLKEVAGLLETIGGFENVPTVLRSCATQVMAKVLRDTDGDVIDLASRRRIEAP